MTDLFSQSDPDPKPIRFVLPIQPTAQLRVKVVDRPIGNGRFASRAVKHKKQEAREATIETFLMPHRPDQPIPGPVKLTLICYMKPPGNPPPPARRFGLTTAEWRRAVDEETLYHPIKPDKDNMVKNIKDCMTRMGFWVDDCLVVESHEWKIYSRNPRWEVIVDPVGPICMAKPTAITEVRVA